MKVALLALAVSFLSSCAELGYLAKQGNYLFQYSGGTDSIDDVLRSPSTPADTRRFLERVKEIRQFAVTQIGLRDNGNYTRYKSIDRDYLVDVVQACDPLSFTPYQWSYPFMGKLPYKGFYVRSDAAAEEGRLKKEGYDVIVRRVDAFSTLGLVKDPVYSFMMRYSPYELASTIIHEQTHATLWVKGQTDFNEELADFVGETGALEWIVAHYGADSAEYRDAVDHQEDFETFVQQLKSLGRSLSEVYDSPIPSTYKLQRKAQLIAAFKKRLSEQAGTLFHSATYRKIGDLSINNAYISLYNLYTADVPLLRSWYQDRCGSNLKEFMLSMEKLAAAGDVKEQIRRELPSAR